MLQFLIFGVATIAGVAGSVFWWKWRAPYRAYAAEHIHPVLKEIGRLKREQKQACAAFSELKRKSELFTRDFSAEINQAMADKDAGYKHLEELKRELDRTYKKLKSERSDLDWWYRRTKGTRVPKKSWRRPDLRDRDRMKLEIEALSKKIGKLKSEKDYIFRSEIQKAKDELGSIHADRRELKELRASGMHAAELRDQVSDARMIARDLDHRVDRLHNRIAELKKEFREALRTQAIMNKEAAGPKPPRWQRLRFWKPSRKSR